MQGPRRSRRGELPGFPEVAGADGWAVAREGNLILVRFKGSLRGTDGADSVARAIELMGSDRVHLIGQLFDLQRYESQVRQDWQSSMLPYRSQIGSVVVGATKALVRMGVNAFGVFVNLPVTVVSSPEEFAEHLQRLPSA